MNLLIADDDIMSREILREIGIHWGCETFLAGDGAEVASLARYVPVDIALCAVSLPPYGGFHTAQALTKKHPKSRVWVHLPVTASGLDELILYGCDCPADLARIAYPAKNTLPAFLTAKKGLPCK